MSTDGTQALLGGIVLAGTEDPEAVVGGNVGWLYQRLGTAELYQKLSGADGTKAGWAEIGAVGGNPFDQDLNTTDTPQFTGVGIGTPGVSGQTRIGVGNIQFVDEDGAYIDGTTVAGALSLSASDGLGATVAYVALETGGLVEIVNNGGARQFNPDGSSTFPGVVVATTYTATTLPASDAGLTAGQFYHTAGAVMVKL